MQRRAAMIAEIVWAVVALIGGVFALVAGVRRLFPQVALTAIGTAVLFVVSFAILFGALSYEDAREIVALDAGRVATTCEVIEVAEVRSPEGDRRELWLRVRWRADDARWTGRKKLLWDVLGAAEELPVVGVSTPCLYEEGEPATIYPPNDYFVDAARHMGRTLLLWGGLGALLGLVLCAMGATAAKRDPTASQRRSPWLAPLLLVAAFGSYLYSKDLAPWPSALVAGVAAAIFARHLYAEVLEEEKAAGWLQAALTDVEPWPIPEELKEDGYIYPFESDRFRGRLDGVEVRVSPGEPFRVELSLEHWPSEALEREAAGLAEQVEAMGYALERHMPAIVADLKSKRRAALLSEVRSLVDLARRG